MKYNVKGDWDSPVNEDNLYGVYTGETIIPDEKGMDVNMTFQGEVEIGPDADFAGTIYYIKEQKYHNSKYFYLKRKKDGLLYVPWAPTGYSICKENKETGMDLIKYILDGKEYNPSEMDGSSK